MPRLRRVGIDFLETAPTKVSTEADIGASIEEVWAALVDNAGWVEWFEQTGSITADPPTWTAAGDTRTIAVGPLRVDEVAIEVTEGERWAMSLIRTNIPLAKAMIEVVDLRDTSRDGETRTELRWTMAAEPLALLKPFWGRVQSQMSGSWLASFENLHLYLAQRR